VHAGARFKVRGLENEEPLFFNATYKTTITQRGQTKATIPFYLCQRGQGGQPGFARMEGKNLLPVGKTNFRLRVDDGVWRSVEGRQWGALRADIVEELGTA
jgi:hypothetical protein